MSRPAIITALDITAVRAILEGHARFLEGRNGGRRANLSYTDLTGFDLDGFEQIHGSVNRVVTRMLWAAGSRTWAGTP